MHGSKKAELTSTLIQEVATGLKHFADSSTQPRYGSVLNFIFPLCFSGGASPAVSIPTHAACGTGFALRFTITFEAMFFRAAQKEGSYKKGRIVNAKFNAE